MLPIDGTQMTNETRLHSLAHFYKLDFHLLNTRQLHVKLAQWYSHLELDGIEAR